MGILGAIVGGGAALMQAGQQRAADNQISQMSNQAAMQNMQMQQQFEAQYQSMQMQKQMEDYTFQQRTAQNKASLAALIGDPVANAGKLGTLETIHTSELGDTSQNNNAAMKLLG